MCVCVWWGGGVCVVRGRGLIIHECNHRFKMKGRKHFWPDVQSIFPLNWCVPREPLFPRSIRTQWKSVTMWFSINVCWRRCLRTWRFRLCLFRVMFPDLWIRRCDWTRLMSRVWFNRSNHCYPPPSPFLLSVRTCTQSAHGLRGPALKSLPSSLTALTLRATDVWEMFPLQLQAMPLPLLLPLPPPHLLFLLKNQIY